MAGRLIAEWYWQVWPNIAASLLCAGYLDARNEVRHQEALHGRRKLPRPRRPRWPRRPR